jgi:hypothetical protein
VVENERIDTGFYERNYRMAADADREFGGKASPSNSSELRSSEIQDKAIGRQTSRGKACKPCDLMLDCETFGLRNRYFSKANIGTSSNNVLSYTQISHLLAVDWEIYRSVCGRSSELSIGLCGVSRIGKE